MTNAIKTHIVDWADLIGKYGINGVMLMAVLWGGYDLANKYIDHLTYQTREIKQIIEKFADTHAKQSEAVMMIANKMSEQNEMLRLQYERSRVERRNNR